MMNIPIYRAKKLGSNEYVEGFYAYDECHKRHLILSNNMHGLWETRIDPSTLSIHFPDMLDSEGSKIFASLSKDGKGGDMAEGYCRDCNGDNLVLMHKPVNFKGLVRFYSETVMGVVIETSDEIIIPCEGHNPLIVKRGEPLRWSDCRQNIKVVGIKK